MSRHALYLLIALFSGLAGATEIRIAGDEAATALAPFVSAFEDKSAKTDINEIVAVDAFAPNAELLRPGFTRSAIWLKIEVTNTSALPLTRWLEVQPARLQDATLFLPEGEHWRRLEAGTAHPFAQRQIAATNAVFPIELKPRAATTAYLRIAGPMPIVIVPVLWDPLAFRTQESRTRLIDGLLLGGLAVMPLLGLLLLTIFRDPVFLLNILATTTYFLGEFADKGYSFMHLWPEANDWVMRGMPLYAMLGVGFNLLFLRSLLHTRVNFPRINRLLLALLAAEWLPAPGILLGDTEFWAALSFPQHFPITVVMMLVGIYAAVRGVHAARYYTVAYAILAVGSLFHGMTLAGRPLPLGLEHYALPMGMLLNNLFLLASVVDRVMAVRREKETAQNALLASRAAHESELERTVEGRTAELNEALAETRKASQTQALLLAYISHDLRAPLATIMNCVHRLERHEDPDVRHHQTTIERSAIHQLELIDDLVEYARGEFDRLELTPEPTFLHDWLDTVAGQAELLTARRGNRFILLASRNLPPVVVFDAKRLRQVVINLLANAAKFTDNGEVRLALQAEPRADGKVVLEFTVEDTGKGIPSDDMERIFEPFERRQSKREGSGLGLSIARQIMHAMGSDLHAASTLGVGSRFTFRLTLDSADETAVTLPTQAFAFPEPFGAGKSILIADDNATSREYMREILGTADFDIACARDGVEALQMAAECRFDIILVDQIMPGMGGWEVLRRLHESATVAVPPIILCSAMRAERPEGFPAGIDFTGTLLKPVLPGKLLVTVWEALREHASPLPTVPPEAMLTPLRALIDGGNISEIEQWSATLATEHPEYAAFANAIEHAAIQIDFTALNTLASSSI